MDKPKCSKKGPYALEGKKKKYAWCSCGKSATQPYCDGKHQGTNFSPIIVTNDKYGKIYWCGCKRTSCPPYCDGSHKEL